MATELVKNDSKIICSFTPVTQEVTTETTERIIESAERFQLTANLADIYLAVSKEIDTIREYLHLQNHPDFILAVLKHYSTFFWWDIKKVLTDPQRDLIDIYCLYFLGYQEKIFEIITYETNLKITDMIYSHCQIGNFKESLEPIDPNLLEAISNALNSFYSTLLCIRKDIGLTKKSGISLSKRQPLSN